MRIVAAHESGIPAERWLEVAERMGETNSFEYIAKTKKTSGGDWFAPSYMIPDDAKEQIHQWVQQQQWPEGTKFPEPEKYHVTGLYSPSGFSDEGHQQWAQSKSGAVYPVQTTGVDAFTLQEKTHAPIVLRVHNPELIQHTEQMMQEAKERGLPISEFPGGYKPHITVAHSPEQVQLDHPHLSFPVGPLRDLHGYYDELKSRRAKTAAWDDHFVNQIEPIAKAYERMPMYDPEAVPAWQELADNSMRRAAEIRKRLNVEETPNPEPYGGHEPWNQMFDDINRGQFKVSSAFCEHPIWTPEQNMAFRTVHDVEGHYPTGGDFGWEGENKACGAHFPTLSPNAQRALMTECLGQTGYAIARGGFGPQKVGFMDEHLQPAQQAYNPAVTPHGTFSHVPPRGFCHRHIRHGLYRLAAPTVLSAIPKEVAKFVYHPLHNRLFLGEMGKEEGQMPSHSQLATMSGWDPKELTYGQVGKNGYGETFGRPKIKGFEQGGMNQYEQEYRTQEALRRAVPGTKFTQNQDLLTPKWELPGDPEVQYVGQPPSVEVDPETPDPAQWEF